MVTMNVGDDNEYDEDYDYGHEHYLHDDQAECLHVDIQYGNQRWGRNCRVLTRIASYALLKPSNYGSVLLRFSENKAYYFWYWNFLIMHYIDQKQSEDKKIIPLK